MAIWQRKITSLFSILLISSILLGGFTGYWMGNEAAKIKPLGDIFLNLLLTAIVPLVFFSVAATVAQIGKSTHLRKILLAMSSTFIFTGIIAAMFMLVVVILFPPAQDVFIPTLFAEKMKDISIADQLVEMFTVSDFMKLFSHNNMLSLIFFSILTGLATSASREKGEIFARFLRAGADISINIISLIMYLAPIGFFAYFAALVGELGPKILDSYFRVTLIYYITALFYFVFAFTFYAFLANKTSGIKQFWQHIFLPMITSLATCSSAASIPANLQATKKMGVPSSIYETVIPLGAILHKDGSVLGGMLKIAFIFGIYHLPFSGPTILLTALLIALLVGTVMGAIPGGGMLGEMLILSFYGFPKEALMMIVAISIIIDPLATMINVTGDTVCSMMVARLSQVRPCFALTRHDELGARQLSD